MTDRLKEIFANLGECRTFADVGCDHGYIAKAMLDSGKATRVIMGDVSAPSLKKAEVLLKSYILENRAVAVVGDGFENISEKVGLALIAGMGGKEIVKILEAARDLPQNLVVQPMKNCEYARSRIVAAGYRIIKDYTFMAGGKFYALIVCERGADSLTAEETEFGRTNLTERPRAFIRQIQQRIEKTDKYLKNPALSAQQIQKFTTEKERLIGVLCDGT